MYVLNMLLSNSRRRRATKYVPFHRGLVTTGRENAHVNTCIRTLIKKVLFIFQLQFSVDHMKKTLDIKVFIEAVNLRQALYNIKEYANKKL